jgi:hypothetical protein
LRKFIILGSLALTVAVGFGGRRPMQPTSSVAQTYSKDAGYFYRFRAGFEVKETGERLDFDYVVACNIRLTRWRDGGLSDDTRFSPRLMVKATAAGQAVMVQTLEACHGLTSDNDDVPSDVLPVAIWFDDVADLSSGLGYVSEDAYANPLGKLKFFGARIDHATRADWEAWRQKSAAEYVERGALLGPWGHDTFNSTASTVEEAGRYVSECQGYSRVKLPESLRERVRALWPSERPRFWTVPNSDSTKALRLLSDPTQPSPPGVVGWIGRFGTPSNSRSSGLPVKSGREVQHSPHVPSRWSAETYPIVRPPLASISPLTALPLSPATEAYVQKLEFRAGALNGFGGCQNVKDGGGAMMRAADPEWKTKRQVFMVDDVVVRDERNPPGLVKPELIFERDEYVLIQFSVLF